MSGAVHIERRAAALEIRAAGRRLAGLVAPFDVETRIGLVTEIIRRGAFAASLTAGSDILALADHDPGKVLARTKAGSLRLREAPDGLHFETADLPNTTAANDVLELVRSGNAGGMSFGFKVPKDGDRWQGNRRELMNVELREISVISSWPAYPMTSITARGGETAPARLRLARLFLETV